MFLTVSCTTDEACHHNMSDNSPLPAPSSQGGETKNTLDHLPVAHIIGVSGDASNGSLLDALPLVLAEPSEPPTSPTSPTPPTPPPSIVNAWNKNTSASLDFTRLAALYDQGFSLAGSAKEPEDPNVGSLKELNAHFVNRLVRRTKKRETTNCQEDYGPKLLILLFVLLPLNPTKEK